jgi:hypothetical protein
VFAVVPTESGGSGTVSMARMTLDKKCATFSFSFLTGLVFIFVIITLCLSFCAASIHPLREKGDSGKVIKFQGTVDAPKSKVKHHKCDFKTGVCTHISSSKAAELSVKFVHPSVMSLEVNKQC